MAMMRWVLVTVCSASMAIVSVAAFQAQTSSHDPVAGSTGDVQVEVLGAGADVYLLSGGGGNTLAVVDEASGGIVLVDPKPKGWGKKVVDALRDVTDLPVTTIINTHAHDQQIGGNGDFPMATQIIAHANTKSHMAKLDAFKGANARFLPNTTVTTRHSLLGTPNRIDLYAFGAGHTDGDLIVVFPDWKLAYFGDLFPSKRVPIVDAARGGSAIALSQTLAKAAAEIKGIVKVVTGAAQARNQYFFGPVRNPLGAPGGVALQWADVEAYAAFNAELVAVTKAAHDARKSVDEAVTTLKLSERFATYDMSGAREYVAGVYAELTR